MVLGTPLVASQNYHTARGPRIFWGSPSTNNKCREPINAWTTDHGPQTPQTTDRRPRTTDPERPVHHRPLRPQTADLRPRATRVEVWTCKTRALDLGPWTLDRGHARRRALSGVNFDATRRCAKHQPRCITKLSYRTRPKEFCGFTHMS